MMIRAYHAATRRRPTKVLVPDTAHGTNPASCTLNGYEMVPIKTGADGISAPRGREAARDAHDDDVAAIMMTNPNTLGLFEEHLGEIARLVHEAGGLVYSDGANLNALLGRARPGDVGVDVMQINLHKTFTTPHGGGGPGSGAVGVVAQASSRSCPSPTVEKAGDKYRLDYRSAAVDRPAAQLLRQLRHVRARLHVHPRAGRRRARRTRRRWRSSTPTTCARVLADHLLARRTTSRRCTRSCSPTRSSSSETGVQTLDVAKRLIDYGYPPADGVLPAAAVTAARARS